MLVKINNMMRTAVLISGAVFLIYKLTEKKKTGKPSEREGFQTEEFDDIW